MGGLRARLIRDSFLAWLEDGLDSRGWFDVDRRHGVITLIAKRLDWDEPIEPNLIAVHSYSDDEEDTELGSTLTERRVGFTVDVLAESEALGSDVIFDVRDLLRGKFPSILRGRPVVPVYDYRQATPTVIFNVHLDEVEAGRRPREFQRGTARWYQATCVVIDANGGETYGG